MLRRPFRFTPMLLLSVLICLTITGILLTQTRACAAQPSLSDLESVRQAKDVDLIRVGLSDNAMTQQSYGATVISAVGRFAILDENGKQLKTFDPNTGIRVQATRGLLTISVQTAGRGYAPLTLSHGNHKRLRFSPLSPDSGGYLKVLDITRKGSTPRYRGDLDVIIAHHNPNQLMTVNSLPMQDYLRAVVPNELPIRFGEEAVRAQSVAARNYALRPREKTWPEFDICDSQMCQAYYGQQTETAGTDALLTATEGLMLLHEDTVALTLYSSSSGGVTEDYRNVFSDPKSQAFPPEYLPYLTPVWDDKTARANYPNLENGDSLLNYLKGGRDIDAYDKKSRHFRWEKTINANAFKGDLSKNVARLMATPSTSRWMAFTGSAQSNVGTIQRFQALERGESGKLITLRIHTSTGTITATKEFVIRSLLAENGRFLESATFAWEDTAGGLKLFGTGFGHGVGMSQYGASGMHDRGIKFQDILTHYYPGTALGSLPVALSTSASMQQRVQGVSGHKVLLHVKPLLGMQLRTPMLITVNDSALRIPPFLSYHRVYDVTPFMNKNGINTLVWPQLSPLENPVKVWISFHKGS